MKVAASVRTRCDKCSVVNRNGVIRIRCSSNKRHKARQG